MTEIRPAVREPIAASVTRNSRWLLSSPQKIHVSGRGRRQRVAKWVRITLSADERGRQKVASDIRGQSWTYEPCLMSLGRRGARCPGGTTRIEGRSRRPPLLHTEAPQSCPAWDTDRDSGLHGVLFESAFATRGKRGRDSAPSCLPMPPGTPSTPRSSMADREYGWDARLAQRTAPPLGFRRSSPFRRRYPMDVDRPDEPSKLILPTIVGGLRGCHVPAKASDRFTRTDIPPRH